MPIPEEPLSESLRGVEDLSLKFSIDIDVKVSEHDAPNKEELTEILIQKASSIGKSINIYCPGRRQWLYVVAVDCYSRNGSPTKALPLVIKNVMQAAGSKSGQIGFVLLTGLSLTETKEVLKSCQVKLEDFDVLVCNSGSEMYYPWRDLIIDEDYEAHIEYRWPGENVKLIVTRLVKIEDGAEDDVKQQINQCSSLCFSYRIKQGEKTRNIDDLRQRLRMRGLRCNLVYTHAASRLNVIPLFASRDQALRYLSVRWGIELPKIIVFVGERGDTDFKGLLGGLHKTVILRDSVEYGSEMLVHSEDSYKKNDLASEDSPNIVLAEGFEAHEISKALGCLGTHVNF